MTLPAKPVALLYQDQQQMLTELQVREPSFHATLQMMLPKVLLLAAASEFEHYVCLHLRDYVHDHVTAPGIVSLIDRKAISRQYHTYFDWPRRKAGPFWALFGKEQKRVVEIEIAAKDPIREGQEAFLEIGSIRNELVHSNYATFTLNKTLEEVYELYLKGASFVEEIPRLLRVPVDSN
ncbi:HEPN domain-containing protein [Streptomyces europaeiscabiei]|uniref:HEPN domain-containing protein n=1 Tax=Streptomyces europaeiscabiei TaxID=146819 RepID=UPI0029B19FE1|nr:HEPN domain-containing protein [Streptomyces europaeiscabiei]MDX3831750.1 HEPN domain-containing protein [Streptomyces europaeiscabiei]